MPWPVLPIAMMSVLPNASCALQLQVTANTTKPLLPTPRTASNVAWRGITRPPPATRQAGTSPLTKSVSLPIALAREGFDRKACLGPGLCSETPETAEALRTLHPAQPAVAVDTATLPLAQHMSLDEALRAFPALPPPGPSAPSRGPPARRDPRCHGAACCCCHCLRVTKLVEARAFLWPAQLRVGVAAGAETAVHTVRAWLSRQQAAGQCKVLLKLDFRNAFNCLSRRSMRPPLQPTSRLLPGSLFGATPSLAAPLPARTPAHC